MKHIYTLLLFCTIRLLWGRELTMWILPGAAGPRAVLQNSVKQFETESGIKVHIKVLEKETAYTKIENELMFSTGVHIIQMETGWVTDFAGRNYLADLSGLGKTININRFNRQTLDSCTLYGSEKLFALPWFMDVKLLYVNKKYADSINFDLKDIKNYRGFREFLTRIKAASFMSDEGVEVSPYGFPGSKEPDVLQDFSYWIWSAGGDFILPTPGGGWRSALFDDNTVRGLYRYLYFARENLHSPKALKKERPLVLRSFLKEEYAAIITDDDLIKKLNTDPSEGGFSDSPLALSGYYTFLIPAAAGGSTTLIGGSNFAVPGEFAYDPAVRGLLAFLTKPAKLDEYSRSSGELTPDTGLWNSWRTFYQYSTAISAARTGKTYLNTVFWPEAEPVLAELFREIWKISGSSGYSEEKLYTLIAEGDRKIRAITGESSNNPQVTLDAFSRIIAEYDNELKPIRETPLSNPLLFISLVSILTIIFTASIFVLLVIKLQEDKIPTL